MTTSAEHRGAARKALVVAALVAALATGCGAVGEAEGESPGPAGDAATWELLEPTGVSPESTNLRLGVTRLGCASGVTGEVLTPVVSYEQDRVVVVASVAPFTAGAADCQGNDVVPVDLVLTEPVGERTLVDGACLEGPAVDTSFCLEAVRWAP